MINCSQYLHGFPYWKRLLVDLFAWYPYHHKDTHTQNKRLLIIYNLAFLLRQYIYKPTFIVVLRFRHDDVIKRRHFRRYWPFVRGIHRSSVNCPYNGQWRGALMFSLVYGWINGLVNNRDAGDLRRHRAHYDVIVILFIFCYKERWKPHYFDFFKNKFKGFSCRQRAARIKYILYIFFQCGDWYQFNLFKYGWFCSEV